MGKLVGTRDAYGKALVEVGKENPRVVVLDADLSSSTKTRAFAEAFPERFFNAGIAEANMIGMAAGLAQSGKVVFASSFAVFATGRAYDQIRQSVAYPKFDVKIAATHAGLTVGPDGATHQALEDIALMRVMPNMSVVVPCDAQETAEAVRAASLLDGPVYLRLGREPVPAVMGPDQVFKFGRGVPIYPKLEREQVIGRNHVGPFDALLVACGAMVEACLEAAHVLGRQGIRCLVLNFASVKPLDKDLLVAAASMSKAVITAEEHSVIGGLGSAVCECLSESHPAVVRRIGVRDEFGQSGTARELLETYGLTASKLVVETKDVLGI